MLYRTVFTGVAVSAILIAAAQAAGVSLPNVPIVPPIVGGLLPGGGVGGPGGGGLGGGGTGGGITTPPAFGDGSGDFQNASARGTTSWGDPLGAELFGDDKFKARVHYYGDAGSQRSEQSVGLIFSIAN